MPAVATFLSSSLVMAAALAMHLATSAPAVAQTDEMVKIVTLGTSLSARGGWQEPLGRALGGGAVGGVAGVIPSAVILGLVPGIHLSACSGAR